MLLHDKSKLIAYQKYVQNNESDKYSEVKETTKEENLFNHFPTQEKTNIYYRLMKDVTLIFETEQIKMRFLRQVTLFLL